jgi:hypothetical protein
MPTAFLEKNHTFVGKWMLIFVHPASSGSRDSRAVGLLLVVEITLFCDFPAFVLVQMKNEYKSMDYFYGVDRKLVPGTRISETLNCSLWPDFISSVWSERLD